MRADALRGRFRQTARAAADVEHAFAFAQIERVEQLKSMIELADAEAIVFVGERGRIELQAGCFRHGNERSGRL
ncbi:hypothetical protein PPGU19_074430 (plasmid) [Paraburkholderia sp. PGU19]|nr:hypothetical protein PPGU19_074430 [Paraburkholderia sp. PGU19]